MNKQSFWCFVMLVSLPFVTSWLLPEGLFVHPFTRTGGTYMYLGEIQEFPLACCKWGRKIDCQDSSVFACAAAPVYCAENEEVEGICNTAVCSSDGRSGARCRAETFTPTIISCYLTGLSTTDGCPSQPDQQAKCEFTEMQLLNPPTIFKCASGTTLCDLQYSNVCM